MRFDRALKRLVSEAVDGAGSGADEELAEWNKTLIMITSALNGEYREFAQNGDLTRQQIKQLHMLEGRADMLMRTVKRIIAADRASGAE